MNIRRPVRLLQSEIINIPAVFGHLKPVIFIPLGLLAQLPPAEVEAILMHELAHIRRSDFLVNCLQNVAENFFFFNPAVLWISALIREERENCCDDMVIGETRDKKQYIQALVNFKELSLFNPSKLGMGFPGRSRHSLVNRVARLVQNKNKALNTIESFFLGMSLVILGIFTVAFAQDGKVRGQRQ